MILGINLPGHGVVFVSPTAVLALLWENAGKIELDDNKINKDGNKAETLLNEFNCMYKFAEIYNFLLYSLQ